MLVPTFKILIQSGSLDDELLDDELLDDELLDDELLDDELLDDELLDDELLDDELLDDELISVSNPKSVNTHAFASRVCLAVCPARL
jgi:hypothetical protein